MNSQNLFCVFKTPFLFNHMAFTFLSRFWSVVDQAGVESTKIISINWMTGKNSQNRENEADRFQTKIRTKNTEKTQECSNTMVPKSTGILTTVGPVGECGAGIYVMSSRCVEWTEQYWVQNCVWNCSLVHTLSTPYVMHIVVNYKVNYIVNNRVWYRTLHWHFPNIITSIDAARSSHDTSGRANHFINDQSSQEEH